MNADLLKSRLVLPPGAFRLLLAGAVVLSHASRLDVGRIAVLLFFYLSGYWVARIYRSDFAGRPLVFYASRWLRIVPLYFLVLFGAAALRGQQLGWENLTLFGVATTKQDPTGVAWSLDLELQFYLILPLLMAIPARLSVIALAVLTALGWWLHVTAGVNTALMYLPAFGLGMANAAGRWNPGQRVALGSLAAFAATTALFALLPITAPFFDKNNQDRLFDQDIFGMIWMLPLVPYVAYSLTKKSSPFDRDVGNWSYPLYLVHYPLIAVFAVFGLSKWLAVAVACALALALFYLLDKRYFEPMRRWAISGEWPRRKALAA